MLIPYLPVQVQGHYCLINGLLCNYCRFQTAANIWEKTGIEPFSIEQLSEQFEWNATQPTFDAINTKIHSLKPVYVDLKSSWKDIPRDYQYSLRKTDYDGLPAIDAIVVHKKRRTTDSRRLWLEHEPEETVQLKLTGKPDVPHLVQVFPAASDPSTINDRVPIDQTICQAHLSCSLAVKPGIYWLKIWTNDGVASLGLAQK